MLSFQRLDVYQCSVAFAALAVEIATTIARGHGALSDDVVRCLGVLADDRYHHGMELLARTVAMLTKLCR